MAKSFDLEKHARLMLESEEYLEGYNLAAECIGRMLPVTPENLVKMAFVYLGFKQLKTAGMAYCYWELGNSSAAA